LHPPSPEIIVHQFAIPRSHLAQGFLVFDILMVWAVEQGQQAVQLSVDFGKEFKRGHYFTVFFF
jgi:hypothetical protein